MKNQILCSALLGALVLKTLITSAQTKPPLAAQGAPVAAANSSLSNLVTTSVNQDLIPNSSGTLNFGSPSANWGSGYFQGAVQVGTFAGSPSKGMIQWNGSDFLGFNGTSWLSLTGGGSSILHYDAANSNLWAGGGSLNTTGFYNTGYGVNALLNNSTGSGNSATGFDALVSNTSGLNNTANGATSLFSNSTGSSNTSSGYQSLYYNTTGHDNAAFGFNAGVYTTTGYGNVFQGSQAGLNNTTGLGNVFIGYQAGVQNTTGFYNTCIGFGSGVSAGLQNATAIGDYTIASQSNTLILGASQNVGIGTETPSTKLTVQTADASFGITHTNGTVSVGTYVGSTGGWIATQSYSPLYFCTGLLNGNGSAQITLLTNGNVGIGTISPAYKLSVNGTMQTKEVRVETGWSDYVFDAGYKLRSLGEVEKYIQQNKHLPDIPSAADIQKNGLAVGESESKMMAKIEELTLYVIQLQKEVDQLKLKNNEN